VVQYRQPVRLGPPARLWVSTRCVTGSKHTYVYNTFNVQHHLTSARTHRTFRAAAMNTWREAVAAA
jgi:hypothetical protein